MQPEQPDTPANDALPVADAVEGTPESDLPIAEPIRPARRRRDPAEAAREAARIRRMVRASLVAVAVVLMGVFVAAYRIYPYDENGNPRTMSTHTQLGMPPCNFVVLTGKPCPSCGMTTSFALLVRGDVLASLRANWVGSVICMLWAATLFWSVGSAVKGKTLFVPRGRGEMIFTFIVGGVVILMLARWAVILLQ